MSRTGIAIWLSVLLAVTALSGCIGGDEAEAAVDQQDLPAGSTLAGDVTNGASTTALKTDAAGLPIVEAPAWTVGQWFGYEVFFGDLPDQGFGYKAVVAEDKGPAWLLATDSAVVARYEAMFDIPVLGDFKKTDLSTTDNGQAFEWYRFPLADGATWTSDYPAGVFIDEDMTVEYSVTFNPAISTAAGPQPGFDIKGHNEDGVLVAEYDYVPAIGWFAHLFLYDPEADDGEDGWFLHLMTNGSGLGFKGEYYVDTAVQVVEHVGGMFLDPTSPVIQPNPVGSFEVAEGATVVHGFQFAFAFTGAQDTKVIDPQHNTYDTSVVALPLSGAGMFREIVAPAVPGTWHVTTVGAGVAAFGGFFAFAVTENVYTM